MARKMCVRCNDKQAVRPGGLCNRCYAKEQGIVVKKDIREMPLSAITLDGGIQTRCGMDDDIVDDYAEALADPDCGPGEFPPVVVFTENDSVFILADGFHRFAAHRKAGLSTISVDVRRGNVRDALLYSCGANAKHGLNRSPADKRKAVAILLQDSEWKSWSDRAIAKACGVGHGLVADVRRDLAQPALSERQFQSKHGTPSTMDTARIGKSSLAAQPVSDADEEEPDDLLTSPEEDGDDGDTSWLDDLQSARPEPEEEPAPAPRKKPSPVTRGPDESIPEDALGNPVPETLRGVFADPTLGEAAERIDDWLEMLLPRLVTDPVFARSKFFPFVRFLDLSKHLEEAHESLVKALEVIQAGRPHAVCPKCGGHRCGECRQAGYVPAWRYQELK